MFWNIYTVQGAKSRGAAQVVEDETNQVQSIVRSMVEQLRGEITGKLSDILSLISKGGKLRPASVASATSVLNRIDSLNILGDVQLRNQTQKIRNILQSLDLDLDVDSSTISGLTAIQKDLKKGLDDAVVAAEKNLTSLGRRKLDL